MAIVVEHVSFNYHDASSQRRVLDDVNLRIDEGEFVVIMGANGSGKSTLARCLNGLLLPHQGEVVVDGCSTRDETLLPGIRRKVGMLFQNPDNQIVSATVEREIAFGLENIGMPCAEMHECVEKMLQRFHLTALRRKSPHYLSGGEKQRLALAAVLAMTPDYLVLDEPTSLLDPSGRQDMLDQFQQWHDPTGEHRRTLIMITQFPDEALAAQRLIVLHRGRIIMDDRPDILLQRTQDLKEIGLDSPAPYKLQLLLGSLASAS